MSITNGYATLADLKGWLNIGDTSDDTELEVSVEAASRMVDDYCDRHFYSGSETRYYTPLRGDLVIIDDLTAVTTLKTDTNGDGTFNVTWTSSDYNLGPYNAATDGEPYRRIERSPTGARTFDPCVPRSVEVAGTFGWTAVPTSVKKATLLQASRLWRRGKDAPLGIVHLPGVEGAGGMRLHAKVDPDVAVLLHDFRRSVVKVG